MKKVTFATISALFLAAQAAGAIPFQARLDEAKCHVEFIMKDISTVRHDPKRLWE